ncbi:iron uptake porin [Microcoleus sp.]|uniref:iron uptake porin n=1 Tax=Microcoleus sp. TaxID=44472 RepID=UPI0035947020
MKNGASKLTMLMIGFQCLSGLPGMAASDRPISGIAKAQKLGKLSGLESSPAALTSDPNEEQDLTQSLEKPEIPTDRAIAQISPISQPANSQNTSPSSANVNDSLTKSSGEEASAASIASQDTTLSLEKPEIPTDRPIAQISPISQPANSQNTSPSSQIADDSLNLEAVENLIDPSIEQVTSVSQLSDVRPTDWAFQALQSLVERYGCIAGYPDGTFRGNRAMTRYEFAAGLNACLDKVSELIRSGTGNLATKEDLTKLQRLQEEFAAELATLRGRVDALEARTAELEANQFSTTTKLNGQVLMYLGDAFGDNASDANNTTFGYRARLNLNTSFTGKDRLSVGLQAINLRRFNTATEFPTGRLSGVTDETRVLGSSMSGNSELRLSKLTYDFPVNNNLMISLAAFSSDRVLTEALSPFSSSSIGALSYFGSANPMLYPVFQQSGISAQWKVAPWLNLDLSLGSEFGSANNPNIGLFEGGYGASVRSVFELGKLRLALNYVNSYSLESGIDTISGSNAAKVIGAGPVAANTYLVGVSYNLTQTIQVGGSVAYANARTLGTGTRGDADVWDYRFNFAFRDVGKKGNLAGLVFGMQPRLAGTSNSSIAQAIGLPAGQRSDRNVGYHIEAFYTHRLTDNIDITPGFIWLTAPNHDARNPDVVVGVLRTSFSF